MINQILLGSCLEILRTLPDASVDCVVTDPPYGLGTREPSLDEILAYLQGDALDTGGDFMGADWTIPPVAVWKECLRVLKPGGHLLSFAGTRTMHLIAMGIQVAGFQCRDTVATQFGTTVLQWLYGQGFPKSLNISKALEKRGAPPEVVERWKGWGTALKPAWEPVLVFRKPLEGAVLDQVLLSSTGALNIGATRVATGDQISVTGQGFKTDKYGGVIGRGAPTLTGKSWALDQAGRWPANVLLVHSTGCKVVGSKKVQAPVINRFDDGMKPFGDGAGHAYTSVQTGDADGMEEIPVYECEDGCPVKLLDHQSGELRNGGHLRESATQKITDDLYHSGFTRVQDTNFAGDTGGASRFFGQIQPDAPFFYTSKVSKAERNKGLVSRFFREGMVALNIEELSEEGAEVINSGWPEGLLSPFALGQDGLPLQFEKDSVPEPLLQFFEDVTKAGSPHPTMKPLALMQWLVKLVAPKGSVVLDPYCGSGTTCIAALEADCNFIGIERDPRFHEVAVRRIEGLRAEIAARADDRRAREALDLMLELEQE